LLTRAYVCHLTVIISTKALSGCSKTSPSSGLLHSTKLLTAATALATAKTAATASAKHGRGLERVKRRRAVILAKHVLAEKVVHVRLHRLHTVSAEAATKLAHSTKLARAAAKL
jgi:hypothetical protein